MKTNYLLLKLNYLTKNYTKNRFPSDPKNQLFECVGPERAAVNTLSIVAVSKRDCQILGENCTKMITKYV
jgi:hypothetical protein